MRKFLSKTLIMLSAFNTVNASTMAMDKEPHYGGSIWANAGIENRELYHKLKPGCPYDGKNDETVFDPIIKSILINTVENYSYSVSYDDNLRSNYCLADEYWTYDRQSNITEPPYVEKGTILNEPRNPFYSWAEPCYRFGRGCCRSWSAWLAYELLKKNSNFKLYLFVYGCDKFSAPSMERHVVLIWEDPSSKNFYVADPSELVSLFMHFCSQYKSKEQTLAKLLNVWLTNDVHVSIPYPGGKIEDLRKCLQYPLSEYIDRLKQTGDFHGIICDWPLQITEEKYFAVQRKQFWGKFDKFYYASCGLADHRRNSIWDVYTVGYETWPEGIYDMDEWCQKNIELK